MITINTELELSVQDKYFVDLIQDTITGYGQIPYTVPPKIIINAIKQSARLFYNYYSRAQKTTFYRLTKDAILDFQKITNPSAELNDVGRVFMLPSYISVVKNVYTTNKTSFGPLSSGEISTARNTINRINGINNHLYAMEQAALLVEESAFNAIFAKPLVFHYNSLVKQLEIYADFDTNLVLECWANIPIQYLYNDNLYIRHVVAETKRELKRIIGSHTINLPGDVSLNIDEICNNLEDAEKVEEVIKQSSGVGDIILMGDDN